MPVDPNIDAIKQQLDQVQADDIAEDAAYEAQIANLAQQLATITAERDQLANERTATIADLVATRDALQSQLTSLDARITALGG